MNVTFEHHGDDYLPCCYRRPDKTTVQPTFLQLDLHEAIASFDCDHDDEPIDTECQRNRVRWEIPAATRNSHLGEIVKKVLPLLQIAQDGFYGTVENDDDTATSVPILDNAAQAAVEEIRNLLGYPLLDENDPFHVAAIWDPADWIRAMVDDDVDGATTDAQLEDLDGEYRDAAESEGIHVFGDMLPLLIALREP